MALGIPSHAQLVPAAAIPAPPFELDEHQRAACDFREGLALVAAAAGSGKTTVLVERTAALIREGTVPEAILTLVFNRDAAQNVRQRLATRLGVHVAARCEVYTFHAWAYALLRAWFPREPRFFPDNLVGGKNAPSSISLFFETAKKVKPHIGEEDWRMWLQTYDLARDSLVDYGGEDGLAELAQFGERYLGWSADGVPTRTAKLFRSMFLGLDDCKKRHGCIDFADMTGMVGRAMRGSTEIAEPLRSMYQHVQVDEAQDINIARYTIARHLGSKAQSCLFVGDSRQCQPGGTLVLRPDGSQTPIGQLRDGDEVVAWDRRSKHVSVGARGYRVKVAMRSFKGILHSVQVAGRLTETTPNHRWLARWDPEAASELCAVYVMRRTIEGRVCYRMGWCKVIDQSGGGMNHHYKQRARLEGADAIWLVKLTRDRAEASAWESILSTQYQIPLVMFNPGGNTHYQGDNLALIWRECAALSAEGAVRLFADHHLEEKLPLWAKATSKPGRQTLFEVHSANLCDGMMLPVPDGRTYQWRPIERLYRAYSHEPVFSLDVAERHSYVADGICTLNSIYGFSGSRPDVFLGLLDEGAELLTLPVNRRSTRAVVAYGNGICKGYDWHERVGGDAQARDQAPEGTEVALWQTDTGQDEAQQILSRVKELTPETRYNDIACLARTNAQLGRLECRFVIEQVPCRVLGTTGGIWATGVGRDFLAYLRAAQGTGTSDLPRVANKPKRYASNKDVWDAIRATKTGIPLISALERGKRGAKRLGADLLRLQSVSWPLQVTQVKRWLVAAVEERNRKSVDLMQADEDEIEAYTVLAEMATGLGSMVALEAAVREMSRAKADAVTLSTFHRAKGLEWPLVFVCGASQGQLPHKKASDLEEERRLFYVGVTRAKNACIVSTGGKPSEFLRGLDGA